MYNVSFRISIQGISLLKEHIGHLTDQEKLFKRPGLYSKENHQIKRENLALHVNDRKKHVLEEITSYSEEIGDSGKLLKESLDVIF